MKNLGPVAISPDFELGPARVRPGQRSIETANASVTVEPLVMRLLVALSRRAGQLLTRREIFDICWGSAPVGDDSLNRVVAVLRKALHETAGSTVSVDTVPGAGYLLRLAARPSAARASGEAEAEVRRAIEAAFDSWRLGLPEPDHLRLELTRRACDLAPEKADAWGWLAILCRLAAEYAGPDMVSNYVAECEAASRSALSLEPDQAEARVALAGVAPLFGRWLDARCCLTTIIDSFPAHAIAAHDLAIVEMATGRVHAAKSIVDGLIAADPLAACYCYKSIYQHWSVGDQAGMDHVADRSIQLWPTHPAVWTARLWTLAYTGRVKAGLDMLDDAVVPPNVPPPLLGYLRQVLQAFLSGSSEHVDAAAESSMKLASKGPAGAIASLFALGLLDTREAMFAVAESYYLRGGSGPVPVRPGKDELSITDQHRRVTQILFTPVFAKTRADPRFLSLCQRMGLVRCWDTTGLGPDFLA